LAGDDADQEVIEALNEQFKPLSEHIDTIINGTQRIKIIVQDLRSFTHLHSADKKPADIVECIESTINLVKAKYFKVAEFHTDFNPLPKLQCYPAQLNQVFFEHYCQRL
jgi:signal transduction histidine kinase